MLKTKQRSLSSSVPMTEGSLWRNILIFSLPLMLSQILQKYLKNILIMLLELLILLILVKKI